MSSDCSEPTAAVHRIFAERLNVEVPSHDTDLFDAGLLDSLMLVDLIVHIERDFGMSVSMEDVDLESFRSVRRIAAFLVRQRERDDANAA